MFWNTIMSFRAAFLLLLAALPGVSCGEDSNPSSPPQDEIPLQDSPGYALIHNLNCAACHEGIPNEIGGKQAPRLDQVTVRVAPSYLVSYLQDPKSQHPSTTMPDPFAGFSPDERLQAATDIVHFLHSQQPPPFQLVAPDRAAVQRGQSLFHEVGCMACHDSPDDDASPLVGSHLFPDLQAKYSFEGLKDFLARPLHYRPSGAMPSLNLSSKEAADIAHFLLRQTRIKAPLDIEIHRGHRRHLDDQRRSKFHRSGVTDGFDLTVPHRDRDCFLVYSGFLHVANEGLHTFTLEVDDIGRLTINDEIVVEISQKDRGRQSESGSVELEVGWHPIRLEVFQWKDEEYLQLDWAGPGFEKRPIDPSELQNTQDEIPTIQPWVLDPERAAKGQQLFASQGCGQCHQLDRAPKNSQVLPPSLTSLDLDSGCLAEKPPRGIPDFRLAPESRINIQESLRLIRKGETLHERSRIHHRMTVLHCYACHEREGFGGVPEDRTEVFQSTDPSMGPEGNLPPDLNGVGNKLKPEYLSQIIRGQVRRRPYVLTRMPSFGEDNVQPLAEDFLRVDAIEDQWPAPKIGAESASEIGRTLVGKDGLQCILCHTFNRQPSLGIEAIDLIEMPRMLTRDWFQRYMRDPKTFKPLTLMPAFWPKGKSIHTQFYNGDALEQIDAIWHYLSLGTRAKFPDGMSRESLELIVGGETVIYRGKLWEAGFRAIAVGFPEGINLAFDAQEKRLALLWKEKFLNVSAHWNVQGMGRIRPLGEQTFVFPKGPDFAALGSKDEAWPDTPGSLKFLGYEIDKNKNPTFHLALGEIEIHDAPRPISSDQGASMQRTLNFRRRGDQREIWMRVFVGDHIEEQEGAGFVCDKKLRLKIDSPAPIDMVRRPGRGQEELLIRVTPSGIGTDVTLEYRW